MLRIGRRRFAGRKSDGRKMTADERRVAELVRSAFAGVTLGDGVGLFQGQGLDDYADQETLADLRSNDEKDDWSRLSVEDLNQCYSSLSFFDAQGMRFHLPAFLLADLEGSFNQDIIFSLTCFQFDAMSRFSELNDIQRTAVREFLLLRLSDPDCQFERPMIQRALDEYWTT
jgi:Family of unknown function (DUF6714)